ncbi:MAG: hypothetical protein ACOC2W_03690 [bacterium]
MSNLVNVLSKLNINAASAVIFGNNGQYPDSPSLGQLAFVDHILSVYSQVDGVETWYPLLNSSVPTYTHMQGTDNTTWTVNHNLGTDDLLYFVYDSEDKVVYPSDVTFTDDDSFVITFTEAIRCKCIVFSGSLKINSSGVPKEDVINAYFDGLTTTDIVYTGDGDISELVYDTGNKKVINYSGENVSSVDFYSTDGTTILKTQSFTYDANGDVTGISWS